MTHLRCRDGAPCREITDRVAAIERTRRAGFDEAADRLERVTRQLAAAHLDEARQQVRS